METKKSKKENIDKAKAIVKKINNDLIETSFNAIETTIKTAEKWQKKTEPLRKQQINIMVETAESIKSQLENGTERFKTLVGYNHKLVEKTKKKITDNSLFEKVEEAKNKIKKEVANYKFVKKAEKIACKIRKNITETMEEVREKVENYTEEALTEKPKKTALETKKTDKVKKITKKVIAEKTEVVDDLKVIKGIGPVLEKSLNELNITSYAQIANMTIKDLTNMLNEAGVNTKIYNLSGWKAQAKLALKGDFEAVKNWTKK